MLSQAVAQKKMPNEFNREKQLGYYHHDYTAQPYPSDNNWIATQFDLIHDKGTFDAICLHTDTKCQEMYKKVCCHYCLYL